MKSSKDAEKESSKDTDSKKDTAEEKNNHQEVDEKVMKETQKDDNDKQGE